MFSLSRGRKMYGLGLKTSDRNSSVLKKKNWIQEQYFLFFNNHMQCMFIVRLILTVLFKFQSNEKMPKLLTFTVEISNILMAYMQRLAISF